MRKTNVVFKILLITVLVFCVLWAVLYCALRSAYPVKYVKIVDKYAFEYNLDRNLLYSIMKNESGFSKNAVSEKNAVGLMQITPETANWIAEEMNIESFSLSDPETNIKFSCWYVNYLCSSFETVETAVAAYNAGEGTVKKWLNDGRYSNDGVILNDIPYNETKKYVSNVISAYNIYNKLY